MSTNPVDIARYAVQRDGDEPEHNLTATEADRLGLARAVLAVAALADRLDDARRRSDALSGIVPGSVASAEDIRAALNGDNV